MQARKSDIKQRNKEIYSLSKSGATQTEIARKYHVSVTMVGKIIREQKRKADGPEMRKVLSEGTYFAIKRFGINDIDELKEWAANNDVAKIRNIGEKRKQEILLAIK